MKTTLSGEIEKLRYEVAVKIVNLQGEVLDLRAEMKINFSEVNSKILKLQFEFEMETAKIRKELKTEIADLRAETKTDFLELQKSIVDIYKTISTQTRWILGGMLGKLKTLFKFSLRVPVMLLILFLPKKGLEPPQPCGRWHLKPVRLPIPPLRRFIVRNCSYNFDRFSFSVIHYFGIH